MFIRPSAILVSIVALAGAVAAAPNALEARQSSQCDTGSIQCCSQTTPVTSLLVSELAGTLGISLTGITGTAGISCTPVLGSGAVCSQQPTCCTGNSFSNGLLVVGCSPINLNL